MSSCSVLGAPRASPSAISRAPSPGGVVSPLPAPATERPRRRSRPWPKRPLGDAGTRRSLSAGPGRDAQALAREGVQLARPALRSIARDFRKERIGSRGSRELRRRVEEQWFGGRAQQIHEQMKADFNRYMTEIHPTRMQAILEAGGHADEAPSDITAIAAANTFSVAEGYSRRSRCTSLDRKRARRPGKGKSLPGRARSGVGTGVGTA
jgi:hypothetical protein